MKLKNYFYSALKKAMVNKTLRQRKEIVIFSLLLIGFLVLPLVSCNTLSKSQTRVCNTYFDDLRVYNKLAREINEHVAECKFQRKILTAATIDTTIFMIDQLDTAILGYQKDVLMPFEQRKSILKLNNYVNTYSFKSSYNTDFLKNTRKFMTEILPYFGLGEVLFEVIFAMRKLIIKPNVGAKIKKHVAEGNDLVKYSTSNIIAQSETYIKEMEAEELVTKESYENFIKKLKEEPDSWDKYSRLNPIYLDHYGNLNYSKQLAIHLKQASLRLDSLQTKLYELTSKRRKIKGEPDELTNFRVEISFMVKLSNMLNNTTDLSIPDEQQEQQ